MFEQPVGGPATLGDPDRRPGTGPFEGRFVILRPPRPRSDARALYAPSHDSRGADIWTYKSSGPFRDALDMERWLADASRSTDPLFMTVLSRRTDEPIGMVSFLNVEPRIRRLEVGHIWYVPDAQRTEANTEAAYLLLREAFERLGYRRVEWKCDSLNERSRRAALRLGFRFEGIFRQHMIVKGRNRDTAWYAMLDREWPAVRAKIERWLQLDPPRPPLATLGAASPGRVLRSAVLDTVRRPWR